jgi:hypothetical protein
MKSGGDTDVEAAKLRSLFARRHVDAGHFGHVVVSGGAGRLCLHPADGHDLKPGHEQYEQHNESSPAHVQSSENDAH